MVFVHPIEVIEFTIVGVVFVIILCISLLLKGKRRKFGMVLALFTLVAYGILFMVRPFWIDSQIDKKIEFIKPYLEERYPNEKWTISTVDHRDPKNKHRSPYSIGVIFKSEPDVTYEYHVKSKDDIYQFSVSTTNKFKEKWDFKHLHLGKP
ncbi:MAG: hypothetical protein K0R71_805 [Bacillales bacterium]|jgi:hypothetical protein|nr:hypothetical protein [Bacillales bacterium]